MLPVAVKAYSYGPACQWVRLLGSIAGYELWNPKKPLLLTVTYQLPEMKMPAVLLTAYPLYKREFSFVFSGFSEKIDRVRFFSPLIGFDEPVVFRYYATSPNGKWVSPTQTVTYDPQRVKKDGQILCQTKLTLPSIVLSRP